MKVRKIPLRTCCVTHEQFPKKELLRVVRNKDGEVFVDETGKQGAPHEGGSLPIDSLMSIRTGR